MTTENSEAQVDPKVAADRAMIADAKAKGRGATLGAYVKLSGPGWLQSAITLGGGSLAGSLYLGVIGGYQFMWLQPLMMILGIVMLSAIAYVTLSTGERPFHAINKHVNPALGWGWLIASMMANLVWAMPQFSLGTSALEQNLLPGLFGGGAGKYIAVVLLFIIGTAVVLFYDTGGVKYFEWLLKGMVAVVVLSFFGVVVAMATSKAGLPWGEIFIGFIPDFSLLAQPADELQKYIDISSDPEYWKSVVVNSQQDRMVAAAATAVGINMTFLLPYSMLRKGWDKTFRGLATFDLATGLFIPFMLATSCVIIASAAQFHGQFDPTEIQTPAAETSGAYRGKLEGLVHHGARAESLTVDQINTTIDALPQADKQLASMLVERDAFDLAHALEDLTGKGISQYVFGIGVLGMAISTIIILMLINGFCMTEMLGVKPRGPVHVFGSILPGITGALGFLFLWSDDQARFWLAIPTSRIGMILLPVAYVTFFLMMNSKPLMGESILTGGKKIAVNLVMIAAIVVASIGCGIAIWNTKMNIPGTQMIARTPILIGIGVFIAIAVIIHFARGKKTDL